MLATNFAVLQVTASQVCTVPMSSMHISQPILVTNVIHRKAAQLLNPKNISSQINKKNINVLRMRVKISFVSSLRMYCMYYLSHIRL
jgi:hypothetical protein